MIEKLKMKLRKVRYTIDILEYENEILTVKGWIFSSENKLENLQLLIDDGKKVSSINLQYGINRIDVYQNFYCENAKNSGFKGKVLIENLNRFKVFISYKKNSDSYKFLLKKFILAENKITNTNIPSRIQAIKTNSNEMKIVSLLNDHEQFELQIPGELYLESVDIIIPIYNGYEFLDKLLETISLTKLSYRLILINDRSTDDRVEILLKQYSQQNDNVILLENEENLGFVSSVNRGLAISQNNVALVNTDVELPEMWLERLILPIYLDKTVASSTPYSNCATICSFPDFGDNGLFLQLDVQSIDDEFIKIRPRYEIMPTGVGFCMGISKKALKAVGSFDADSFGKGYGEENDWCQRAIKRGYKNVHVENLFVYHKHGGSFLSEEKKKFLCEHEKKLLLKHPYYSKDVEKFCACDPNKDIRAFVKFCLLQKNIQFDTILAFDHALGGGAKKYIIEKKKFSLEENNAFVIIRYKYEEEDFDIYFYYRSNKIVFNVKTRHELIRVMDFFDVSEIWINELVTYPELYQLLRDITDYSKRHKCKLKMLVHDFFSVCPTINLLNNENQYCSVPDDIICDKCLSETDSLQSLDYESISKWRAEWSSFLKVCNEIVVFSNSSKKIMERTFGLLENISVQPHQIGFIPKIKKKYKTTKTLNIGLLGILTQHKGRDIVKELTEIIVRQKLNVQIVLIGNTTEKISDKVFSKTGEYTRESIPRLILENDIDIFLVPSIWPETFSYTTEEIIHMGMPIMCFDIGAPAERVKKYEKGIIISEISAKAIIQTIKSNKLIIKNLEKKVCSTKILFVVEEITFSSRYRVDHLREQLLQKGISTDCCITNKISDYNLHDYRGVVVYRISKYDAIQKLLKKAHKNDIKVYYDIDDYIFEYDKIKNLAFLQGEDYNDFEKYANDINKTMLLCDGYIVSTINLKQVVSASFPGKPIIVNRNVASMEMMIISLNEQKKITTDKIVLGYFSGTKTHDEDFNEIKDVLLDVMEKNEKVNLLLGGQIGLPADFNKYISRIETFNFVSWRELPGLISKADINLMPLEDSIFHDCKSENKWMEAALVKVPTVATWNSEMSKVIEDKITGFLCKSKNEWSEALKTLIQDDKFRYRIAEAAQEKVLQDHTSFNIEQEVVQLLINN